MELTALAGNAQIKAQLAHREGDLAHAYIVAGPAGSGRHTLAAQMAAALVCSAQPQLRPCGRCSHCRKAAGGIHPDITVIAGSGGKPITVDQVRALRTDAYVRPNEAERKVYLLERADRMNASAQNAMLKLLEDGPAYAVFFLLAENGSALLPTVRSRCETLELAPVSPAQAEEWLAKAFPGRTAEEIRRAALECQGILGRAAALLEGGQEEDGLEETARSLSAALEGEDELALFEATQALDKLSREELTAVLDRTLIQIGARLPGSQRPRRLLAAAELLRRLRRESAMPVIMLTARDTVVDKVSGLDMGADDYISKPFAIEELLARIRAALRKRGSGERPEEPLLSAGPLTMDVERHTVAVSGTPVELTRREFDLLHHLLENKGRVLSREALLDSVWGFDFVGETNSVDVYIRFLRSKIDEAFDIKLIHTVRGVGYVIREE